MLLIRPGDPLRASQDEGMWSIPKGPAREDEGLLGAAQRHFQEMTGTLPSGIFSPLAAARMGSETVLYAWSAEGDWDPRLLRSGTFELYWPPGSPTKKSFPQVERAGWFPLAEAYRWIAQGQGALLDELQDGLT